METTAVPCMINVATDVGITGINGDFVININQMSGAYWGIWVKKYTSLLLNLKYSRTTLIRD
jgi:hypothetical protein